MVVDTSAILALLFAEKHGSWVGEQLDDHAGELCMSTVNLTETLILIRDRQPALADELTETVLTSGLRFVCPDTAQAETAARARLNYPLNLGDCFAYGGSCKTPRGRADGSLGWMPAPATTGHTRSGLP